MINYVFPIVIIIFLLWRGPPELTGVINMPFYDYNTFMLINRVYLVTKCLTYTASLNPDGNIWETTNEHGLVRINSEICIYPFLW